MCQNCFFSGRKAKNHKLTHPMQEYCTAVKLYASFIRYIIRPLFIRPLPRYETITLVYFVDHIWRGRARLYEGASE